MFSNCTLFSSYNWFNIIHNNYLNDGNFYLLHVNWYLKIPWGPNYAWIYLACINCSRVAVWRLWPSPVMYLTAAGFWAVWEVLTGSNFITENIARPGIGGTVSNSYSTGSDLQNEKQQDFYYNIQKALYQTFQYLARLFWINARVLLCSI